MAREGETLAQDVRRPARRVRPRQDFEHFGPVVLVDQLVDCTWFKVFLHGKQVGEKKNKDITVYAIIFMYRYFGLGVEICEGLISSFC